MDWFEFNVNLWDIPKNGQTGKLVHQSIIPILAAPDSERRSLLSSTPANLVGRSSADKGFGDVGYLHEWASPSVVAFMNAAQLLAFADHVSVLMRQAVGYFMKEFRNLAMLYDET